jgi:hypothetical protein
LFQVLIDQREFAWRQLRDADATDLMSLLAQCRRDADA